MEFRGLKLVILTPLLGTVPTLEELLPAMVMRQVVEEQVSLKVAN